MRQLRDDFYKPAVGLGEAALTIGSGLASMPFAGWKGIHEGIRYGSVDKAADAMNEFMEQHTYQPRGWHGQQNLETVGNLVEAPIEALQRAPGTGDAWDWTVENSPVAAAAITTGLEVADPSKGAGRTARNVRRVTHYSKRPDLDTVDPKFYGTGGAGAEKKRREQWPEYWEDRSYFGLDDYKRESMLGSHRYDTEVDLNDYYDISKDPDGIWDEVKANEDIPLMARETAYEQAIRKKGYKGYYNTERNVLASFEPVSTKRGRIDPELTNKQSLSETFLGRDDDFWDIDSTEEASKFRKSGHSGVQCTGFACEIEDRLGKDRVQVVGYDMNDNPSSAISQVADGHDFAIVDNRYIVDPWVRDVESMGDGVYDMMDPADRMKVREMYGEPATWKTLQGKNAPKLQGYDADWINKTEFYHGSDAEYDLLEPGRMGAVWVTPDRSYADQYGPNTKKADLDAKNPLDLVNNPEHRQLVIDKFNENGGWRGSTDGADGYPSDRKTPDYDPAMDEMFELLDTPWNGVSDDLFKMGYDAIIADEHGAVGVMLRDPSLIRQKPAPVNGIASVEGDSVKLGGKTYRASNKGGHSQLREGEELVLIDRDDFERLWKTDEQVGPGPEYSNQIGNRIENFKKFWEENDDITVGNFYYNDVRGLESGNGRHRTRVMLESGMEQIPVTMPKEDAAKMRAQIARDRGESPPAVVNIGLNVGDQYNALPVDDIKRKLNAVGIEAVRERTRIPTVAEAARGEEPTWIAELSRPLTPVEANVLAKVLKQEAIPQRVGDVGEMYGPKADAWGPFNPTYFKEVDPQKADAGKSAGVRSSTRKAATKAAKEEGTNVTRASLLDTPEQVAARAAAAREILENDPRTPFDTTAERRRSIFDRALIDDAMEGHPGVAQESIGRVEKVQPKTREAIDARLEDIFNDPINRELLDLQMKQGLLLGGETYYPSTYPLRAFLEERLPDGRQVFEQNMNAHAGTSPQSALPNNMASQSLVMAALRDGVDLNDWKAFKAYADKVAASRPGSNKYFLGPSHVENFQHLDDPNYEWKLGDKDKVRSYGSNLLGNFENVALDTHEAKGASMGTAHYPFYERSKGFAANEYGAFEGGYRDVAEDLGLRPGSAQAGRWYGGGELTGLKTGKGDWLSTFEHMVVYTAEKLGRGTGRGDLQTLALEILTGQTPMVPYYPTKKAPLPKLSSRKELGFANKDFLKVLASAGIGAAALGAVFGGDGDENAEKVKSRTADLLEEWGE